MRSRWSSPFAADEAGPTPQVDESALTAVLLKHDILRHANEERFERLQAERKVCSFFSKLQPFSFPS